VVSYAAGGKYVRSQRRGNPSIRSGVTSYSDAVRPLVFAVLMVACSPGAKPSEPSSTALEENKDRIGNVALGCGHVYEPKPGAYAVVFVGDRVAWIDDTLKELKIAPLGGGDVVKFEIGTSGEIHDAIVVGADIITDASADAVRRISLADRKTTTLAKAFAIRTHSRMHTVHFSSAARTPSIASIL
jgi:hypothetical protein